MPNSISLDYLNSLSIWDYTPNMTVRPNTTQHVPPEQWDNFRLGDLVKTVGSNNINKGRIGRIVYIVWRKDMPKAGTRDNMHTHREFIVEWLPDDKTETHASASVFTTHSGLALAHYDEYNL